MKSIYIGIAMVALATAANASTASEREYKRGYADCSQGKYDQNQHGASYKAGCRAAEDAMKSGSTSSGGSANVVDVAGVKVPKAAMDACFNDAVKGVFQTKPSNVHVVKAAQEGADNFYIELSDGHKHVVCTVNSKGEIFNTEFRRL